MLFAKSGPEHIHCDQHKGTTALELISVRYSGLRPSGSSGCQQFTYRTYLSSWNTPNRLVSTVDYAYVLFPEPGS